MQRTAAILVSMAALLGTGCADVPLEPVYYGTAPYCSASSSGTLEAVCFDDLFPVCVYSAATNLSDPASCDSMGRIRCRTTTAGVELLGDALCCSTPDCY